MTPTDHRGSSRKAAPVSQQAVKRTYSVSINYIIYVCKFENTHFRWVDQRQALDVLQDILHSFCPGGGAVALIETEGVAEGVLTKPDMGESVEETFVKVVCHPATVENLA